MLFQSLVVAHAGSRACPGDSLAGSEMSQMMAMTDHCCQEAPTEHNNGDCQLEMGCHVVAFVRADDFLVPMPVSATASAQTPYRGLKTRGIAEVWRPPTQV